MSRPRPRRALISVYDKTGVVEFARALQGELGFELLSTGGTFDALRTAGVPVTAVEAVTGSAEMLGGRVKTLHPAIHAALLADRDDSEHMRQLEAAGIVPIELLVVNLYPFEQAVADPACTFEQAIEMIDIGGVALLRAAAKNHRHVTIIQEPRRYAGCLSYLRDPADFDPQAHQQWLAERGWEAFWTTSRYDAAIACWLARRPELGGYRMELHPLHLEQGDVLRYGENPHQSAVLFDYPGRSTRLSGSPATHDARELSYNNYLDADAALGLCEELASAGAAQDIRRPSAPDAATATATAGAATAASPAADATRGAAYACVFIKHTNPCGAAVAEDPVEAYRRAYLGDPNAAMGGVLAVSFTVDAALAAIVMETYARFGKPLKDAGAAHAPGGFFVEVWLAPHFTKDAVAVIEGTYDPAHAEPEPGETRLDDAPHKDWGARVRLIEVRDWGVAPDPSARSLRSISGGLLVQSLDLPGLDEHQWRVASRRAPTEAELADLRLAWLIAKYTKSNAVSLCHGGMLLGCGAGQTSRVVSSRLAVMLARENGHADRLAGAAAASDAFFPFRDGVDALLEAGVTAVIHPGGGKRDAEVIAACDERGAAMVLTGTRHFRH